jgi:uncharacterized DUF497 family protein
MKVVSGEFMDTARPRREAAVGHREKKHIHIYIYIYYQKYILYISL